MPTIPRRHFELGKNKEKLIAQETLIATETAQRWGRFNHPNHDGKSGKDAKPPAEDAVVFRPPALCWETA